MTRRQLKEGEIYYVKSGPYSEFLVEFGTEKYLCINDNFISTGFSHYPSGYRRATEQEKIWFNTCQKEGKFIPFDEIIFSYEIY